MSDVTQRPRRFHRATLTTALAVGIAVMPVAAASSVTAVAGGGASVTSARAVSTSARAVSNPTAEGTALVKYFFRLLVARKVGALGRFLSPAFQAVRANGDVQDKASYLARLPDVKSFAISRAAGRASGGVITVSYLLRVKEIIDGKSQPVGPAPRLSVFAWRGGAWRLVAHANFGAIKRT